MPGMVETVELLGRLRGGGPVGNNICDRIDAPSTVVEGLAPGVGE